MMRPFWLSKQAMSSQVKFYNKITDRHRHDPEEIDHVITRVTYIGESRKVAIDAIFPQIDWYLRIGDRVAFQLKEPRKRLNNAPYLRCWEERVTEPSAVRHPDVCVANIPKVREEKPIGSAENWGETLLEYERETGELHFALAFAGLAAADTHPSMRRFADEVAPVLTTTRVGA